jgi:hypothetical protein
MFQTFGYVYSHPILQVTTIFCTRIDNSEVKTIKEGFFIEDMAVGITVDGKKITSHVLHKIWLQIQGSKHHNYLQDKHKWDDSIWSSIDWHSLKATFLSLGPHQQVKASKSIHGWLNTSQQKFKISPDAVDSHKCPCCQGSNETQEHILMCPDICVHKKCHELVIPVL